MNNNNTSLPVTTGLVKKSDIDKGHGRLIGFADSIILKVQSDIDGANNTLSQLNVAIKDLEVARLAITKPINEGLGNVNTLFKTVKKPLKDAYDFLDKKVMVWRDKEKEKIDAENERLRLETEEKNNKLLAEQARREKIQQSHEERGHQTTQLEEPVFETAPEVPALKFSDSTKVRLDWTWELMDLKQIPREYLMIDKVGINKAIREGVREINGTRIYQKEVRINERPF